MAISYAADIRPLFRDGDIRCMGKAGVKLDDLAWMSIPANASAVYGAVSAGSMPPDKPWASDHIALLKAWIDAGYPA